MEGTTAALELLAEMQSEYAAEISMLKREAAKKEDRVSVAEASRSVSRARAAGLGR